MNRFYRMIARLIPWSKAKKAERVAKEKRRLEARLRRMGYSRTQSKAFIAELYSRDD